ncbi:MAG: glycosyltransferase family 39 protein [Gemmatimonadales bacterium]
MPAARSSRVELAWLGLILLAGTCLRVWGLGTWAWEEDELYTLRDARDLGIQAEASGAPGIAARPIYYLLQHFLLLFSSPTPLALRIPPVVFGILGIVATWWLGKRVFGGRAGLVSAVLVAVSPWHIYASQFARYWSLVYLLAATTIGAMLVAADTDRRRSYLLVLITTIIGMLTHPTFLFPLAGVVLALHTITADGRFQFVMPRARALKWLWVPLAVFTLGWFLRLGLYGRPESLQNATSRGLGATLRLVPAMVQWLVPSIAIAAAAACAYLFVAERDQGRRWATLTIAGVAGALILLIVFSIRTAVYSDYGISVLPLIFVAIGGAVGSIAQRLEPGNARPFAVAAGAGLALAVTPETVSHLADGSRFDYRPAFAMIHRLGPDYPVTGRMDPFIAAYAPDLRYTPMEKFRSLRNRQGFWLVASVRRLGLREGGPGLQVWIDSNCRRVSSFERPRFDYRLYRVELYWCGSDPVPQPSQ